MHRRDFLAATAGGVSWLAGCGAWGRGPGTDTPRSSPPGTTGRGTRDESDRIDVALETSRYLVRAFEQRPAERAIDREDVVPASDLPDDLRNALRSARDGGYETEAVSEELLAGIDRFRHNGRGYRFEPYVSLDGTPYAFDPTVPVFLARLDLGVDDPDPGRTVGHDDLERFDDPVRDFVRTMAAYTAESPRDEYRVSVVPPSVRAFLDRYEYVRDPEDVGRIVESGGPEVALRLEEEGYKDWREVEAAQGD